MISKKRILGGICAVVLAGGISAGTASAAGAWTPAPTPTPTPTITPTPVPNQFAGCAFSFSVIQTFNPVTGQFVRRADPAIVCNRFGRVRVYDLVR